MGGWVTHQGQAVALPLDNIDTDQLIPARFMSVPRAEGYGDYLLHDMRRDADGQAREGFALNRHPEASILVAGRNFGTGSSREAAVYALADAGFRVVIAPSFGDIFASNAVNNGVLPARLDASDCDAITALLGADTATALVDLETTSVTVNGTAYTFALDETWRTKLINGWDDIDLTGTHGAAIRAYRNSRHQTAPWAWPAVSE